MAQQKFATLVGAGLRPARAHFKLYPDISHALAYFKHYPDLTPARASARFIQENP
jgi:hypothetical protein